VTNVRQVEGQDKQAFVVMVPLGIMLQPGMRATLYPKDIGEKAQRTTTKWTYRH
jgi:invasion protein IalB